MKSGLNFIVSWFALLFMKSMGNRTITGTNIKKNVVIIFALKILKLVVIALIETDTPPAFQVYGRYNVYFTPPL